MDSLLANGPSWNGRLGATSWSTIQVGHTMLSIRLSGTKFSSLHSTYPLPMDMTNSCHCCHFRRVVVFVLLMTWLWQRNFLWNILYYTCKDKSIDTKYIEFLYDLERHVRTHYPRTDIPMYGCRQLITTSRYNLIGSYQCFLHGHVHMKTMKN